MGVKTLGRGARVWLAATLLSVAVLGLWWLGKRIAEDAARPGREGASEASPAAVSAAAQRGSLTREARDQRGTPGREVFPGELPALVPGISGVDPKRPGLLRQYGAAARSVDEDLLLVDGALRRFWLLFKDPDLLRVGSNAEIVECLAGGNPEGFEFVSRDHPFVDDTGQLLDRWGTPLFFHAESMLAIEIRSAGPDGRLFTEDDVFLGSRSGARLQGFR